MKSFTIKIVNKNKEGIIYKLGKTEGKLSWEEFNKNFEMIDKFKARPKESYLKFLEEVDEGINNLVVITRRMTVLRESDLVGYLRMAGVLSKKVKELESVSGFSSSEIMSLVQQKLNALIPWIQQ